ncbi:MAG TPA: Ku protein [Pseudonocardiaceae bacterium]|jgi:DNA end-binding protein Ku|nr:Ku protein [Pseudonocardiaceae bacterium]
MRSVWNGTITFGPVAIPVQAFSATEERGSGLHQLHVTDGGRIKLRRTCEIDGADVPFEELGKGVELPDGDVVVLTQEDLAGLPVASEHAIEVRAFTPLEQIDPLHYNRSYYLAPEPAGAKPYVLLGEALRQSGRVAVVTVALRQRETLAMLRERGNVIVLTTLLWPDEIRAPEFPFLDEDVSVRMNELRSAVADVERLSGDFEPHRYADGYRAALRALVNQRADAGDVVRPTAARQDATTTELVENLRDRADATTTGRAVDHAKAAARKAAAAKAAATRAANRARSRAHDTADH